MKKIFFCKSSVVIKSTFCSCHFINFFLVKSETYVFLSLGLVDPPYCSILAPDHCRWIVIAFFAVLQSVQAETSSFTKWITLGRFHLNVVHSKIVWKWPTFALSHSHYYFAILCHHMRDCIVVVVQIASLLLRDWGFNPLCDKCQDWIVFKTLYKSE